MGEAFAAYRECVAQDPRLAEKGLEFDELNQKIFNRMKTNIERAHQAARCRYPKTNGTTCRAPRVRGKKFCHMHLMMEEARPQKINLPNLADARGIHGAIAKGRAGGGGWKAGLQTGINTGVLPATGIEQCEACGG
ncbi:MAG TPA: hypothetical protein VJW20_05295 [Candidatus Angelobacter sp.]|nr:hypothetical protein [Candidatus Angelobacter sp.]